MPKNSLVIWGGCLLCFAIGAATAIVVMSRPAHAAPSTAAPAMALAQSAPAAASKASMGDIVQARARPIDSTEEAVFGQNAASGGNPLSVGGDSAASGFPEVTDDQFMQTIRVTNLDAASTICVRTVAKGASAKCTTACGAATVTCASAAATDGTPITAGSLPLTLPITGLNCLCVRGSAASVPMHAVRWLRAPLQ